MGSEDLYALNVGQYGADLPAGEIRRHGGGHFPGKVRTHGDAEQGGAGAGDAESGGPETFSQPSHPVKAGDELCAEGLVQPVLEGKAQKRAVPGPKRFQQQRRPGDIENRIRPGDRSGKYAAGPLCGQFKIRYKRCEKELAAEGEGRRQRPAVLHGGDGEPTEKGRGNIIRVALNGCGDTEKFIP